MASLKLPDFDDLPKIKDMPQGCAWGVFDKGGKKDVLGTLNLLTPDVVKAAAAEVKDGVSVSLKYAFFPFMYAVLWAFIDESLVGRLVPSRLQDSSGRA
jgi:hypothetical protein